MGQSDYAAANAFMDAFVANRNERRAANQRNGHSVAIDWPLWRNGGMRIDAKVEKMLVETTGIELLDDEAALSALENAISSDADQLIVATGDQRKIERFLGIGLPPAETPNHAGNGAAVAPAIPQTTQGDAGAPLTPNEIDSSLVRRLTEDFLMNSFATAVGVELEEVDPQVQFQNLGVDSFIGLQLLNDLEREFGPLPKTLLFENHCVADLTDFFVQEHFEILARKFAVNGASPSNGCSGSISGEVNTPEQQNAVEAPLFLAEADLPNMDPKIVDAVASLVSKFGAESNAIGRGNFAPFLFLDSQRQGMFYCNKNKSLLVTFGFIGPPEHLGEVLDELEAYSNAQEVDLYLVENEQVLESHGDRYLTTPFAVLQRASDLQSFSLDGKPMLRLRQRLSRFERNGKADTREYTIGSDPKTDEEIIEIIDRWSGDKVMVNPYVHRLQDSIRRGELAATYRVFLTRQDTVLKNVIIISGMPSHGGYLMDCEFYASKFPGLEFGIVSIIEKLKSEGAAMFSLGVTWGAQVADGGQPDEAARKTMLELSEREIFDGKGNLQFKNKFRPENRQIYLFRKNTSERERVLEIILMIANSKTPAGDTLAPSEISLREVPERTQSKVILNEPRLALTFEERIAQLDLAGCNPANIDAKDVEYDLASDSWAKLSRPWIESLQTARATQPLITPAESHSWLRKVFPFACLVATHSGREAERCLWQSLQGTGKRVIQNFMFPTFIYNQIEAGYCPEEASLSARQSGFGCLLDLDLLRAQLAADSDNIAAVCVELATNAGGGIAVPETHLSEIKSILAPFSVPLILDGTRLLDNTLLERGGESDFWHSVRETCAIADVMTASLCKNFRVTCGGLVATNNYALSERLSEFATTNQLSLSEKRLSELGAAFSEQDTCLAKMRDRQAGTQELAAALTKAGMPVYEPRGGHAVLIDVLRLETFATQAYPLATFLDYLYQRTGIRGGIHCTGLGPNKPLNGMIRLAVPVDMPAEERSAMIRAVENLSQGLEKLDALEFVSKPKEIAGDAKARYRRVPSSDLAYSATDGNNGKIGTSGTSGTTFPKNSSNRLTSRLPSSSADEIAIVGLANRYPHAGNPEQFWRNLIEGRDCIEEQALARWNEPLPDDHEALPAMRWGGFVDNVDRFDTMFFGISPREAALLDPQERLFLTIAWETLEDAGYTPDTLSRNDPERKIGVYVGAVWQLYQILGSEQTQQGNLQTPNSLLWSIANRVSAFMNFSGPSMTVDTACSGSLASIHLACQAIRNGDCSAAIAGGVNLDLHASKWLLTNEGGFLSPDGRCKAFGQGANGYVAGDGVGAVLLRPLQQAIADRDNIYGVIKGSAFRHGGRASGYAVPNPNAQADMIASAIEAADIDPRTINYIETHGTGTQLGDPIEVKGLTDAFRRYTRDECFCAIGSVKSNIGHLEAAAGIAGLSKVLLQMRNRTLAPSLHCKTPNEMIPFDESPFYVQTEASSWQPVTLGGITYPLRAGVSSFGAGGANLHLIVEEAPPRPKASAVKERNCAFLIPLSAHTEEQLGDAVASLESFLGRYPDTLIDDIAFTLREGRQAMKCRLAVLAENAAVLRFKLATHLEKREASLPGLFVGNARRTKSKNLPLNGTESEPLAGDWADRDQLDAVAEAWVCGRLDSLGTLSDRFPGRRISLPTYPFAEVSHWIKPTDSSERNPERSTAKALHPLLDRNVSDLDSVRFQKDIAPQQYVFRDHIVAGSPTLPGVGYIEMAVAAYREAHGGAPAQIRNLVWATPINSQSHSKIDVELSRKGDATLCEIVTRTNGNLTLHAQCKLSGIATPGKEVPRLDLSSFKARFSQYTSKEKCYTMLSKLKFGYGHCLQAIDGVEHDDREGLTHLKLPEILRADFDRYHLHPSLMDGAVQSIISVVQNESPAAVGYVPYVPFVATEIDIYHPLTMDCFAYLRLRKGERERDSIKKVDVTMVDETGRVLVDIREFVLKAFTFEEIEAAVQGKPLPAAANAAPSAPVKGMDQPSVEEIYLTPVWS